MKFTMMHKTLASLLFLLVSTATAQFAQEVYIEGTKLSLGMPAEDAFKALSDFRLTKSGESSLVISKYIKEKETYSIVGVIGIKDDKLTYISRDIDTEKWPQDKGFSVAMALYQAISGAISATDSDGAKRTKAEIEVSDQDFTAGPTHGRLNTMSFLIEGKRVTVLISDAADGKGVSASTSVSLE
jgi:hypothetical protein